MQAKHPKKASRRVAEAGVTATGLILALLVAGPAVADARYLPQSLDLLLAALNPGPVPPECANPNEVVSFLDNAPYSDTTDVPGVEGDCSFAASPEAATESLQDVIPAGSTTNNPSSNVGYYDGGEAPHTSNHNQCKDDCHRVFLGYGQKNYLAYKEAREYVVKWCGPQTTCQTTGQIELCGYEKPEEYSCRPDFLLWTVSIKDGANQGSGEAKWLTFREFVLYHTGYGGLWEEPRGGFEGYYCDSDYASCAFRT